MATGASPQRAAVSVSSRSTRQLRRWFVQLRAVLQCSIGMKRHFFWMFPPSGRSRPPLLSGRTPASCGSGVEADLRNVGRHRDWFVEFWAVRSCSIGIERSSVCDGPSSGAGNATLRPPQLDLLVPVPSARELPDAGRVLIGVVPIGGKCPQWAPSWAPWTPPWRAPSLIGALSSRRNGWSLRRRGLRRVGGLIRGGSVFRRRLSDRVECCRRRVASTRRYGTSCGHDWQDGLGSCVESVVVLTTSKPSPTYASQCPARRKALGPPLLGRTHGARAMRPRRPGSYCTRMAPTPSWSP